MDKKKSELLREAQNYLKQIVADIGEHVVLQDKARKIYELLEFTEGVSAVSEISGIEATQCEIYREKLQKVIDKIIQLEKKI
jgi:hypothetical protein